MNELEKVSDDLKYLVHIEDNWFDILEKKYPNYRNDWKQRLKIKYNLDENEFISLAFYCGWDQYLPKDEWIQELAKFRDRTGEITERFQEKAFLAKLKIESMSNIDPQFHFIIILLIVILLIIILQQI